MDNEMIVDFINNVEPDFSYGTSDGMTRAMVESAENIARINDYITESVYEVFTEADDSDKPGFFGKLSNKIDTYFTLFMNIIKKFITKIKGFFMTVKRKLTVAFTKAIKAVGNFLRNRINNNRKKFDVVTSKDEVKIYQWNNDKLEELSDFKYYANVARGGEGYEGAVTYFDNVKEKINDISITSDDNKTSSLLTEKTITFDPNKAEKLLNDEYKVNIDGKLNSIYNSLMKQTNDYIKALKTEEKEVRKNFKKASNKDADTRREAKDAFKETNYAINQWTLLKYRVTQKIASACFKYYKKLFSAVRKVFGGINIFGTSGDYKEKQESANLFNLVQ